MDSVRTQLWRLTRAFRWQFGAILALVGVHYVLTLAPPWITSKLIDGITRGTTEMRQVLLLIVLMASADMTTMLIHNVRMRKGFLLVTTLETSFFERMYAKLMTLSSTYHEKAHTGARAASVAKGAERVASFIYMLIEELAPTIAQVLVCTIALTWILPRAAVVMAIALATYVWLTLSSNRSIMPHRKAAHACYIQVSGRFVQTLTNIRTVQGFGQEDAENARLGEIASTLRAAQNARNWMGTRWNVLRGCVQVIARAIVWLIGYGAYVDGEISVGVLILTLTLCERAFADLWRVGNVNSQLQDAREPINDILAIEAEVPDIQDRPAAVVPTSLRGAIGFDHVTLRYPGTDVDAVRDLSLAIRPGQLVALVGPSGGGKSTLANKLLPRHIDPSAGRITIDGVDLRDYDHIELRRHIGVVTQEPELFSGTVASNIAYARAGATQEEVEAAAVLANADGFIRALPNGYDTRIGERGVKLSGGQKQRLCIARVFLADPGIIVFDEATSQLDSENELAIQHAIATLRAGRTMLVIAHRLSTIYDADTIVVVEDGGIIEQGDHAALLRKNGLYKRLHELQSRGAVLDDGSQPSDVRC